MRKIILLLLAAVSFAGIAGAPRAGFSTPLDKVHRSIGAPYVSKPDSGRPKPAPQVGPIGALSITPSCVGETHSALSEGMPVVGNLSESGVACHTIDVPAGAPELAIGLQGPEQVDFDLYVKHGSPASQSSWDCRPYTGSGQESCSFPQAKAGTWYIMVHAFGGAGDYSLVGSLLGLCSVVGQAEIDVPVSGETVFEQQFICYKVTIPEGEPGLIVRLTSPHEVDLDLYTRHGETPTFHEWDCRPYSWSSLETCRIENPSAGEWFIGVHAYAGFGAFEILVTTGELCGPTITGDNPITATADALETLCYRVASGGDYVRAKLTSSVPADIAIASSLAPEESTDCWNFAVASASCSAPGRQQRYVFVGPFTEPGTFTLFAESAVAEPLIGLGTGVLEGQMDGRMFVVDVANQGALVAMQGLNDYDLFTKRGAPMNSTWDADCFAASTEPVEFCEHAAASGPVYAFVVAWDHLGTPFTVTATPLI